MRSSETSRGQEIGNAPVAEPEPVREVQGVSLRAMPRQIDAAVGWAVVFPGTEMAIVRAGFEEREGEGFVRVYEIKAIDDSGGTVELRTPGVKAAVDAWQRARVERAAKQSIDLKPTDAERLLAAQRWWRSDATEVEVFADASIGPFGDPEREDRVLRVLWGRLAEIDEGGGASPGWYGEPWNSDAEKWYAEAKERFEAANPASERG